MPPFPDLKKWLVLIGQMSFNIFTLILSKMRAADENMLAFLFLVPDSVVNIVLNKHWIDFCNIEIFKNFKRASLLMVYCCIMLIMSTFFVFIGQSGDDAGNCQWSRYRWETCRKRQGRTQHEPKTGPSEVRTHNDKHKFTHILSVSETRLDVHFVDWTPFFFLTAY